MSTITVSTRSRVRYSPNTVAVPFAMILFGFYGTFLPYGLPGIVGFAAVGFLWALFLGFIASRLMRREAWRERLSNSPLFVGIIALGLMAGGGLMYTFMMSAAVGESSTTYAILSALMQPAVPYYIVLNTLLELFVMLFIIFFNWDVDRRHRIFSLIGVGLYLVIRIWTYLVYAETRLTISTQTLSPADVVWFQRTLATDFRPILEVISQGFLTLALLSPVRSLRGWLRREQE
jgi:hypothetical protein